jgi:hypothetical protein
MSLCWTVDICLVRSALASTHRVCHLPVAPRVLDPTQPATHPPPQASRWLTLQFMVILGIIVLVLLLVIVRESPCLLRGHSIVCSLFVILPHSSLSVSHHLQSSSSRAEPLSENPVSVWSHAVLGIADHSSNATASPCVYFCVCLCVVCVSVCVCWCVGVLVCWWNVVWSLCATIPAHGSRLLSPISVVMPKPRRVRLFPGEGFSLLFMCLSSTLPSLFACC